MAENINNVLTLKNVRVKHKIVGLNETIDDALEGELFLSKVTDTETDPATGAVIPPAYVIRVGADANAEDADGNSVTTGWLHAPASDVYLWAKSDSFETAFNNSDIADRLEIVEAAVGEGTGGDGNSLVDQIDNVLKALTNFKNEFNNVEADQLVTGFKYTEPASDGTGEKFEIITVDNSTYVSQADFDTFIEGPTSSKEDLDTNNTYTSFNKLSNAFYTFMTVDTDTANKALDTLKDLQDWITDHGSAADEFFKQIEANAEDILALQTAVGDDNGGLVKGLAELTGRVSALDTETTGRVAVVEAAVGTNATNIGTIESTGIFFTAADNGVTKVAKMADTTPASGTDSITLIIDCN